MPRVLILLGVAILIAVILLLKNQPEPVPDLVGASPEAQFDWYLEHQKPVFVFFHSTTCKTCTDMMAVVDQVYPEFKDQIGLVDVNVYQAWNENLIRRGQITSIPTQVFIDANGQGTIKIGGMQADELRSALQALAGGGNIGN